MSSKRKKEEQDGIYCCGVCLKSLKKQKYYWWEGKKLCLVCFLVENEYGVVPMEVEYTLR